MVVQLERREIGSYRDIEFVYHSNLQKIAESTGGQIQEGNPYQIYYDGIKTALVIAIEEIPKLSPRTCLSVFRAESRTLIGEADIKIEDPVVVFLNEQVIFVPPLDDSGAFRVLTIQRNGRLSFHIIPGEVGIHPVVKAAAEIAKEFQSNWRKRAYADRLQS